ncbi:unnamed protein product [Sympodiomycopsis kandeliae]
MRGARSKRMRVEPNTTKLTERMEPKEVRGSGEVAEKIWATIHNVVAIKTDKSFENINDPMVETTIKNLYKALEAWSGKDYQTMTKSTSGLSAYSKKLKDKAKAAHDAKDTAYSDKLKDDAKAADEAGDEGKLNDLKISYNVLQGYRRLKN